MGRSCLLMFAISLITTAGTRVWGQAESMLNEPEAVPARALHSPGSPSLYAPAPAFPSQRYTSSVGPQPSWHLGSRPARATIFSQMSDAHHCNRLEQRPFGDALSAAMGAQVSRGSEDACMLYHYDFHPQESEHAAELTSRGRLQLSKMVYRLPIAPWPIQIQFVDEDPELAEKRRHHVIAVLAAQGLEDADRFVIFGRQRHGLPATDAVEMTNNLLESVRARGQIIQSGESPQFGR